MGGKTLDWIGVIGGIGSRRADILSRSWSRPPVMVKLFLFNALCCIRIEILCLFCGKIKERDGKIIMAQIVKRRNRRRLLRSMGSFSAGKNRKDYWFFLTVEIKWQERIAWLKKEIRYKELDRSEKKISLTHGIIHDKTSHVLNRKMKEIFFYLSCLFLFSQKKNQSQVIGRSK